MQPKQIISIDFADEKYEDCSAITSICTRCKTIVESKTFKHNDNKPQMTLFIKCPVCGVRFEQHKIYEGY